MSGDGQLRAFIERILRLKEEQDSLAADIREVYAEAKGSGFDKTAMGQLVAHLRKIEKVGADAVEEGQTVFDLYLDAYRRATGTPIATHTHEAAGSSSGRTAEFDSANAGSNPAPVTSTELTDTQEQPEEPARDEPEGEADASGDFERDMRQSVPADLTDGNIVTDGSSRSANSPSPESTQAIADDEAAQANPTSSAPIQSAADSLPGAVKAPEADSSPASGAALSEADVPAFLRTSLKSAADYRPHCQHPEACASYKLEHCNSCSKAMEAASETEAA